MTRYRAVLKAKGWSDADVEREVKLVETEGPRQEIEMWNRVLTSPTPSFNTNPNAFLVRMTTALAPGTALDVGMGQGRNAIWLARQGWDVTGFDPAEKAVAAARQEAERQGVRMTALVQKDSEFDWGANRWDLVVLSYVTVRPWVSRIYDALRPGGVVVLEGFERDATREHGIGGDVVFDANELLHLFDRYRILRYEDEVGVGDFGRQTVRVVRLMAQKPDHP